MSNKTDELIDIILNISNGSFVIRSITEELELLGKRKNSAKILKSHIEKLEHELEVCKHASKTMCELYDKRNDAINALTADNTKLRELLKSVARDSDLWFTAHCDNKKITADCFFDGHHSLMSRIQSALEEK